MPLAQPSSTSKKCVKCLSEKALSEFYKHKNSCDGLDNRCKSCVKALRAAYVASEKGKAYVKNYSINRSKESRQKERALIAERKGKTYRTRESSESERKIRLEVKALQRISRKVKRAFRVVVSDEERMERNRVSFRTRYNNDESFRRYQIERVKKRKFPAYALNDYVRGAIRRGGNSPTLERIAGYTVSDLVRHLVACLLTA